MEASLVQYPALVWGVIMEHWLESPPGEAGEIREMVLVEGRKEASKPFSFPWASAELGTQNYCVDWSHRRKNRRNSAFLWFIWGLMWNGFDNTDKNVLGGVCLQLSDRSVQYRYLITRGTSRWAKKIFSQALRSFLSWIIREESNFPDEISLKMKNKNLYWKYMVVRLQMVAYSKHEEFEVKKWKSNFFSWILWLRKHRTWIILILWQVCVPLLLRDQCWRWVCWLFKDHLIYCISKGLGKHFKCKKKKESQRCRCIV